MNYNLPMAYLLNLIFLIFLGCSHFPSMERNSGVKVDIFHSEAASFLHFLDSGFGSPQASGAVAELIAHHGNNKFKKRENKSHFSKFKSYLRKGYNFKSLVARPKGVFGEDSIGVLAVNSMDMLQFESLLSAILPYDGIEAYFSLKKKFYKDFRKQMWEPTLDSQNNNLKELYVKMEESRFLDHLKLARRFYRSNYPRKLPLKVGLVPIPDLKNGSTHSRAISYKDVQIVPYVVSKGATANLDTIFHEFCHAFYDGQSLAIQKKMEDFYLNNSDEHSLFVYRHLNEILATSWGNGWFAEISEGELPQRHWYSNGYINIMAKKILPLLKNYTNKGKLIDSEFMRETIHIAKSAFPNAHRELSPNTMALKVLSDSKSFPIFRISNLLRDNFQVHWMNRVYPIENRDWDTLKKDHFYNTVVLSENNPHSLNKMKTKFGLDLQGLRKDFLAIIPYGSRYYFWISSKNKKKIEKAVRLIKTKEILPIKNQIISI